MPQRRALYDPHQPHDTSHEARAKAGAAESQPLAPPPTIVVEPPAPEYGIAPAWIDTAGRTRTWALKDPHGTQMAAITTKSAALKLAQLLNRVMADERGPAA